MMIRILSQTMAGGCVARVGEVIEASLSDAKFLIGIAKAEEFIQTIPTPSKRRKPQ
jgi:hypothetical protein